MKVQLFRLVSKMILMAGMLVLGACAGSETAMAPATEGSGYAGVSRGLRSGTDAVSGNAIDALAEESSSAPEAAKLKKTNRQGLATTAGYETFSRLAEIPFYRKGTGTPDAVDSFHYNDEAGAKTMADLIGGGRRRGGWFEVAGGRLEAGLKFHVRGPVLDRYEAGGQRVVTGQAGSGYVIALKNRTKHAVEVVVSVDGLDVMDGKTASVRKRGYVIPAKEELNIKGFRVDRDKVKRFQFGSVDASAAARAGQARNVGVIGLAVYDEDEAQARLARLAESRQRSGASAFPVSTR